jgi:quinoprotein relay system zinc metallohydrolase 2
VRPFAGSITLTLALAIALVTGGWAGAQNGPLPVEQVAPGIYVYAAPYELAAPENGGAIANVGFIVGRSAVAVIDTGNSPAAGERLRAAVRAVTDLPIRYIIATHMHPDHVLGNAAFRRQGARFVASRKLPRALAARGATYVERAARELGQGTVSLDDIVLPDELVTDHMELDLGGRTLELQTWSTAHTDNDLTVMDRATQTWFLGDLVFLGHLPVIDGSLTGWLGVIDRLQARSAERVVPGHGPAAAAWPAAAGPQKLYLSGLAADVRRLISAGASMGEAQDKITQVHGGPWSMVDQFHRRNVAAAFHELEWE